MCFTEINLVLRRRKAFQNQSACRTFLQTLQRHFQRLSSRPCSASLKLDLREDFKGSAFLPFPRRPPSGKQLPGTRALRTARLGAGTRQGNQRRGGREVGRGLSWGRRALGGRRRWREEEDHLHMHEAPSMALFPGSCSGRERRREGVERGRMRRGRGGKSSG